MRPKTFSPEALEALGSYAWPGNVRELLHTVEAAVLAAGDQTLVLPQHLPVHLRAQAVRSRVRGGKVQPRPESGALSEGFQARRPEIADSFAPIPIPNKRGEVLPDDGQVLMPDAEPAGESMPPSWREFQETTLYEEKRRYLLALLQWTGGNVPAAAGAAGLSRQRLYILLREHGIVRQWE